MYTFTLNIKTVHALSVSYARQRIDCALLEMAGLSDGLYHLLYRRQVDWLEDQRERGVVAADPKGRGFQPQKTELRYGSHDLCSKTLVHRSLMADEKPSCLAD